MIIRLNLVNLIQIILSLLLNSPKIWHGNVFTRWAVMNSVVASNTYDGGKLPVLIGILTIFFTRCCGRTTLWFMFARNRNNSAILPFSTKWQPTKKKTNRIKLGCMGRRKWKWQSLYLDSHFSYSNSVPGGLWIRYLWENIVESFQTLKKTEIPVWCE